MTGKMPKYSIITSTYNQLPQVKEVWKSLKKQTIQDFEWIIADDGSTDDTKEWHSNNKFARWFITQDHDGYGLVKILNSAAKYASGEYIVWIMADTRPHPDFLEKLDEVVSPNRLVNGLRVNVDNDGKFIGPDWRIHAVIPNGRNALQITNKTPWGWMTLNTMCMPTDKYKEMGGIHEGYEGYGRMDWDMAMWSHFNGMQKPKQITPYTMREKIQKTILKYLRRGMKNLVTIDLDDYSPLNNNVYLMEKLKERYEGFKITLFTVPWEIRWKADGKGTPITDEKWKPWVEATKQAIKDGWMEIALHGMTHAPKEFERLSYDKTRKRIIVSQKMFENVGIEICDLFKAPQWLISKDGERAVKDMGLTLVEDGYYNWNLKDEMPEVKNLIAHGHIQDDPHFPNGLEQSYFRITKLPPETEWKFLSEVYV